MKSVHFSDIPPSTKLVREILHHSSAPIPSFREEISSPSIPGTSCVSLRISMENDGNKETPANPLDENYSFDGNTYTYTDKTTSKS